MKSKITRNTQAKNARSGASAKLATALLTTASVLIAGESAAMDVTRSPQPGSLIYTTNAGACHVTLRNGEYALYGEYDDVSGDDHIERGIYLSDVTPVAADSNYRVRVGNYQSMGQVTVSLPTTYNYDQPIYFGLRDIGAASPGDFAGGLAATVELDTAAMITTGGACADIGGMINSGGGTNTPPVADAGPDAAYTLGTDSFARLDGRGSFDADGDNFTYYWRRVSGPSSQITVSGSSNPVWQIAPPAFAGVQIWNLTINDQNGGVAQDTVQITWNAAADTTPPRIASIERHRPANETTDADQLEWLVTFDEDVQNVDASDFRVTGISSYTRSYSVVSPNEYYVSVSGGDLTNVPNAVIGLELNQGTNIADLASNPIVDVTPTGANETYTVINATNSAPTVDSFAASASEVFFDPAQRSATVDLTGTFSDPDGDTLTSSITQISGPATTFLAGATFAGSIEQIVRQPSSAGRAVYELSVSDGRGGTDTSQVAVDWTVNTPPSVSGPVVLAPSAPVLPGSNYVLDAGTVTDVDGQDLDYTWTQTGGPNVSLNDPNAANPSFPVPTTGGTFTFTVTISDGVNTITQTVTVTLTVDQTPTADAGADQTLANVAPGTVVTLDGSASSDPEGAQLTYTWRQISGPAVALQNASSATPSFVYPPSSNRTQSATGLGQPEGAPADTLVFGLVVSDGNLSSAEDEVSVTINTNLAPTADAGVDVTVNGYDNGDTVTLDGSASSDPDGDTLTYAWSVVSGSATINDPTLAQPTLTYTGSNSDNVDEQVTVALVVNDGAVDSPADEKVITFQDNRAPTANAGANITGINSGELVTLNGSASSDPDGDALTYTWQQVSGPAVTLSDSNAVSPTFTAPFVATESTLTFRLTVNDGTEDSPASLVTVDVRPVGSITIISEATGGDTSFSFTSDLPGLNATVTTSAGQASLSADRVIAGQYTVTMADPRDAGFALTALTCDDGDSTANISARQATINLAAGEDVVCTFASVNSRGAAQDAIQQMQAQRGALLLSNGPDAGRRMDRVAGRAVQAAGVQVAGLNLVSGQTAPVSMSLNDAGGSMDVSLSALAGADANMGAGSFDVWAEVNYARFDNSGSEGDFSLFYVGADYLVTDRVLVGVLAQFDNFESENDRTSVAADGNGFMVGPYVTARLANNLYADARIAWGQADNSVTPLGTYTDDFDTTRMLFAGSLSGDYAVNNHLTLRPTIEYRTFNETQEAYRDAFGVLIPESDLNLNELSFAPKLITTHQRVTGETWSAFIEAEGIYNFGDEVVGVFDEDFRMRLEGGFSWLAENGIQMNFNTYLDGVGSDVFDAHGFRVSISKSLN